MAIKNKTLIDAQKRAMAEVFSEKMRRGKIIIRDGQEVLEIIQLGESRVVNNTVVFDVDPVTVTVGSEMVIDYLDGENYPTLSYPLGEPPLTIDTTFNFYDYYE